MDKNKEFMREHARSIIVTLRNSKLSGDKLQRRIGLMRKSFKNYEHQKKLDVIEKRMMDIMNITGKQQFSEEDIDIIIRQALGLEIRDYDKSHLVDLEKNEIMSVEPHSQREPRPFPFGDTTITQIGTVTYKDWRGVENLSGLPYYKIERKDENGRIHVNKIFSHINMEQMEDDSDYREAVLYTLLEENNMTKTNCGGYIGCIRPVSEGKKLQDTVKANSKYSLVFDTTDATAIVMLRNLVKQKHNQEKEDSKGEGR